MDLRQQQIQQDASKNHSLIGKEFYIKTDTPNWYKTVYIKRNPMTGNLQSHITNATYGNPESLGIPELPPLMRTKLMSMNNALPYTT